MTLLSMESPLRDRAITFVQQHWLTWVPVLGIIASMLISVSSASWYPEAEPLIVLVWGGVIYGAVLSTSHFRQRTAMILNVAVSIGVTLIAVGRLLPMLGVWTSFPLNESLTIMNVQWLALLDQLTRGLSALRAETMPAIHTLMVIYGLLVWHAAAWLMWTVGRQRRALTGVLLCALPLAINIIVSGQAASLPMLFLVSGVILMVRTAYLEQTRSWEVRQVSYPELVGEDWMYSAVIISIAVLLLAGLTTPEWQTSLKDFFNSFRPPANVVQPRAPTGPLPPATTAPSFVPDLSVVGDPIPPDSNATVFWVKIDDPAPRIGEGGRPLPSDRMHYWRGGIYGAFTGRGWEPLIPGELTRTITNTIVPPGRYPLQQQFDLIGLHSDQLFAVNDPISASVSVRSIPGSDSALLRGQASVYTVTSWATTATANQLEEDSTQYPVDIRANYLTLPDVPQRVRGLANSLTASVHSPYAKAVRIQNYLRSTYRYRLDVPPAPAGRDVVDYFLFDAPGGFCSYYASAMVVMLRLQGVPARIVSGYAMGDYDPSHQAYRVPASAAHAWVEVYFPTYGWVEFEPTTSQPAIAYRTEQAPPLPAAGTSTPTTVITISSEVIMIGAVLAGVMCVIGAALIVRRQRIWRRHPPKRQVQSLYWQMRRSLNALKVSAPASVTPNEFVADYLHPIASRPRLTAAVREIAKQYIAATYADQLPSHEKMQSIQRMWQRTWVERVRVRVASRSMHNMPKATTEK